MHFHFAVDFISHLDTVLGVPVLASYLCNAPSAVHSRCHSSAHLNHTPASPVSVSRWSRSDCPCLRSATAMRKHMKMISLQVPLEIGLFFLFGSRLFFLVSLCLHKGYIQLNLRWCQPNVKIGLMGHLPVILKTLVGAAFLCLGYCYEGVSCSGLKLNWKPNLSNWSLAEADWLKVKLAKPHSEQKKSFLPLYQDLHSWSITESILLCCWKTALSLTAVIVLGFTVD